MRRIAPAELLGREEELAELGDFCRTGTGYVWWRAEAWAGKTALMASLALEPPPGVRIVPFFITARLGAQNDVVAYVDVVLEQLAELAGEGLPALLTAATREAHLLRLYRSAAGACAARGERLVLLVDGLDEDRGVTTGPDAHSIAALLPYDLPVVVSGRLNPPLPADVPEDHPLRDPAIVRVLAPSPKARAIRTEAERELKHLLTDGGLPYDLLALLTAAGGGLTADDLAELTGEVPYRVRDVLRTGPGRTFARRGDAYLLGHEELAAGAREMLGNRALERVRDTLHGWAEEWRRRGWPDGTPDYLLHGYVPMLRASGDIDRMVACALDSVRHDRLLALTGGDATALGEVRTAGEALLARGDAPDLVAVMLRLALRRAALRDRNGRIPTMLPAAWAALGGTDRALAMARGLEPSAAVSALCGVARVLHDGGERARAHEVLLEAEDLADAGMGVPGTERDRIEAWIAVGDPGRAEDLWREAPDERIKGECLPGLVAAWCRAGALERAMPLWRRPAGRGRERAVSTACAVLAETGQVAQAEALARSEEGVTRRIGLLSLAAVLRREGREEEADSLVEETGRGPWGFPFGTAYHVPGLLMTALVEAGALTEAEELADAYAALPYTGVPLRTALATALARTGETRRSWELASGAGGEVSDGARADVYCAWAEAGALDRIDLVLGEVLMPDDRHRVNSAWIRALVRAGRTEEAEHVLRHLSWEPEHAIVLFRARVEAGGDGGRAVELLRRVEVATRRPPREERLGVLTVVIESLADAGHDETAARLARGLESRGARVRAALARGRTEEAWRLVRAELARPREELAAVVLRAAVRAGDFAGAAECVRGARHWGERFEVMNTLVRELLAAGETDRAMALRPHTTEACADIALALHERGREQEADRWLTQAVERTRRSLFRTRRPLRSVVRALWAQGRKAEAADLLDVADRWGFGRDFAAGLVAAEQYDRALEALSSPDTARELFDLVEEFARAGAYERAEDLLDDLDLFGAACFPGYVVLALEHTDPSRARVAAARALHLGPWHGALSAVLKCDPGTVPLVLAEAERLRRALEV
ncbi:hypothetical protein ACFTWS_09565 [Streptomyces sp. NPDC057027]|uniref:hypothetical protein n=1 Tax=Streptomyces sp. NPDC057027 TaxID=3346004 RepID=UPI0036309131